MNTSSIKTTSEKQTKDFAVQCAKSAKTGDIFLLNGTLGAGKTVFARAFIQHLAGEEIDVPSPTFTLVQTYSTPKTSLWHFDLYRLESPDEIYELGWEEALCNNILLIEWPERLEHLKPPAYKEIIIEPIGDESRKITFHQTSDVQNDLK